MLLGGLGACMPPWENFQPLRLFLVAYETEISGLQGKSLSVVHPHSK